MAAPLRPIGKPDEGYAGRNRILKFNHRLVLGASGAISSQDPASDTGVVVSKVAATAGRYLITFSNGRKFRQFRGGTVSTLGPASAAYGANTTGLDYFWRNDLLSSAGTVQVQFSQTSYADAEVPDNLTFILDLKVKV